MTVLGIETSCDETAAAICREGKILSSLTAVQVAHEQFGGVVPEIASREHEKHLSDVVKQTLVQAEVSRAELNAVAVTRGPGLMGALLTGVNFARGLAQGLGIKCLGINHIEAHIFANFIACPELEYPFLCLLVSGGHTQIWQVNDIGKYLLLGETRDDAVGEAFDKGARLLGLAYPGGPEIEEIARQGDERVVKFPQAFIQTNEIEFSFSGLKTALLYYLNEWHEKSSQISVADIAASYQLSIVTILVAKLKLAVQKSDIKTVVLAGGVAANRRLRREVREVLTNCKLLLPDLEFCTDNGAMVAFLGEIFLKKNHLLTSDDLSVIPNLSLKN